MVATQDILQGKRLREAGSSGFPSKLEHSYKPIVSSNRTKNQTNDRFSANGDYPTGNVDHDFPKRLEYSFSMEERRPNWSDKPKVNFKIYHSDNTTIHPRISWKAITTAVTTSTRILPKHLLKATTTTSSSTARYKNISFPEDADNPKWVWSAVASTVTSAFPYLRLTHAYGVDSGQGKGLFVYDVATFHLTIKYCILWQ